MCKEVKENVFFPGEEVGVRFYPDRSSQLEKETLVREKEYARL